MGIRTEAKSRGDKTYYGKPCRKCGETERYVSSYGCKRCSVEAGLNKLNDTELMAPYRTKDKQRSRLKTWRSQNPSKVALQRARGLPNKRQYYANNKDYHKNRYLIAKYGLTLEEYNILLSEQNGACKICEKSCSSGRQLAVDHCHETGKIRGLLCGKCNTAIGLINNVRDLYRAIDYLKENELSL